MAYNIISGQGQDLVDRLNGVILSQDVLRTVPVLNGLTLIFTIPAVTVTFATPADFTAVADQIRTQVRVEDPEFQCHAMRQMIDPRTIGYKLKLRPGAEGAVVLSHLGTANAALGFSTVANDRELDGFVVDRSQILGMGDNFSGGQYFIVSGEGSVKHYFSDHAGAAEVSGVILDRNGTMIETIIVNREGADLFFQLFDDTAAPVLADVPIVSIPILSGERLSLSPLSSYGFEVGIAFGFSSTQDTYTAAATGGNVYASAGF